MFPVFLLYLHSNEMSINFVDFNKKHCFIQMLYFELYKITTRIDALFLVIVIIYAV